MEKRKKENQLLYKSECLPNQRESSPSFCLASIHRLTFSLLCECRNLEVEQDSYVGVQI